jgi:hypothetical protein
MTRLLGIHGIGNHQPRRTPTDAAARLRTAWMRGLEAGLAADAAALDLRVAYYAPDLHRDQAQGADTPEALDDDAAAALLDWVGVLGAPAEVSQGRLTQPARQAATWIARRFGLDNAAVDAFVAAFCREVRTYLRDPAARTAARDTVAAAITDHRPRAVLAHSLGSVVAYETLWAHPELHLDLLVTLGSPLAMPSVVFDRLDPAPAAGQGARPPGVSRWVNIADVGDLVAVPRWLARSFTGVDADEEAVIGPFDFHKVRNYLACAQTRTALTDILN